MLVCLLCRLLGIVLLLSHCIGTSRHFSERRAKYDEMIEVLTHLSQYVPTVTTEKTVLVPGTDETMEIKEDIFHKLALGMLSMI